MDKMIIRWLMVAVTVILAVDARTAKMSALETLKKEFPELVFEGDKTDNNTSMLETLSNFLGNRGTHGELSADVFRIWDTILAILLWQGFIDEQPKPVWSLIDYGFDLLGDFINRKDHAISFDGECPYSYDKAGDLCLAIDLNALKLNWNEARLYCQMMKGGDLAIFKDANQFHNILKYAKKFDPKYKHGFWIGASAQNHKDYWLFINGEYVPYGTPYWGRKTFDGIQNPTNGKGSDKVYAFLDPRDFHYLSNVNAAIAEKQLTVPLCQYFPGRSPSFNHYGYLHETYYHQNVDNYVALKLPNLLSLSNKEEH